MSKKKKIIILSSMVLLLAVTAVANFMLTDYNNQSSATVPTATYFSEYRSEHSSNISEQILQLDSIICDAASDSAVRESALASKLKLTENLEKELGLIKGDIGENEPIVYTATLLEGKNEGKV